jgi:hypothetical protein
LRAQHHAPGEDAHQIAGVERDQQQRQQRRLGVAAALGDEERHRIADHRADRRHQQPGFDRAQDQAAIGGAAGDADVVGERRIGHDGDEIDAEEAVGEQHQQRR